MEALTECLGEAPGIAVIHSSIANLLPPSDGPDAIVHAMHRLVHTGWTIALPAFTFSFCGGKAFHHRNSRSEVGQLADVLLDRHPEARRTPHPIYSFVVLGPHSDEILACRSSTTFGNDSPFGLFERRDAILVMLGCGWEYATQFHRYEEQANVPYRYWKEFSGRADLGDGLGERDVVSKMYVREIAASPNNDFRPAVDSLRSQGMVRSASLWRGRVESARISALACVCREMTSADQLAFISNAPEVLLGLANKRKASEQDPLRVAVLGHSNTRLMQSALAVDLASMVPDRTSRFFDLPYGQLDQAAIEQSSALRRFQPHVSVFCDRLEDLLGQPRIEGESAEGVEALVEQYAANVRAFHEANGGWTIVHRFAALYRSFEEDGGLGLVSLTERMNTLLERRLSGLTQVVWLDVAAEAALENVAALDFRLWHLGRFPFSERFSHRLARRWAGLILATLGKSARVAVIDLDNTIWGGVIGEDGLSGVQLSGDFPGNAFVAMQRVLKALTKRGIALAVCSKNDEDVALEAIDSLPGMQFRSSDIVAHRINWRPKWENIQEIADELNVGVESMLYVDDNPVEREAVRRSLPGIRIVDLPSDPAGFAETLLASPWLEAVSVTAEDRKRVASYRARRQVEQLRSKAGNLQDFFLSLNMKLRFKALDDGNVARAVQLCAKTNQFNTTTRRYSQGELFQVIRDGGDVIVIGLEDRFSELENIGLIVLRRSTERPTEGVVDDYLLSCRVLGRGIETAVLGWALRRGAARGWDTLRGVIIETDRNTPVRAVFSDAGFKAGTAPGEWTAATSLSATMPVWLTICDDPIPA